MIISGIIFLALGILARDGLVWTIGIVLLLAGLIALLLGMTGHAIGSRRHYF